MRRRTPRNMIWPSTLRRHPLGVVIMLAISLWLGWSSYRHATPASVAEDFRRYDNLPCRCLHVVDGDTIHIDIPDGEDDRTRVRLIGIDTPETAASPSGEMYFGPEASAYLKALVLGRDVRLVLNESETRDRYDRLLAYVYLDDVMLNERLVASGHAYADRRFDHPWKQLLISREAEARASRAGLWAGVTPERMPKWRQRYENSRLDAAPAR